jgi:hypothetical protein
VKKVIGGIGLFAGLAMSAYAQAEPALTGYVGTTGGGFHVGVPVRPNLDLRIGAGMLDRSYHDDTPSLGYRLNRKMKSVDAIVDWYPMHDSQFRLSGGIVYQHENRIEASAQPNAGSYTIQGNTYSETSVGRLEGKTEYRKVAPYFGLGWGKATSDKKGWSATADIGVLLQGSPNTSLTSSGCTSPTAMCTQLGSDLDKEKTALNNEVGKYKAYPVLRVGVRYQF